MGISSDNTYDAIVIGSGLGGLSCALHLAKQGLHVLVLEKQPRLGGYSQNYARRGYYFDVSQHVLAGLNPGQAFHRLLDDLQVLDKLEIIERDPMFASAFPDRTYLLPGGGAEPLARYLKSEFPGEAAGIDRYFETIRRMVDENFELFWSGEADVKTYFPARYFKKTYAELLNEFFTEPRLHAILGQLWQSTGLPNGRCAANWAVEVGGMHWLTGNFRIVGGGGRLSSAMVETLQAAGGVVRSSSLVKKVLIEDRVAKGVELERGERFFAPVVVSNASPIQTYFNLVGRELLSKPFAYRLRTLEPSCSLLTLYLGLDRPASDLGLEHHTTFVNHGDDNDATYALAMSEAYDRTDFMVSDYTGDGAKAHPHGQGIVQMLEVAPGKPWIELDKADYDEKKKQVTGLMLDKLARRAPELARHIDLCELGTPRTMLRATRNPFGAVYGWAQTPAQADIYRFGAKSLFKGLYFTGAWSRGGGGGYMGSIINGRVTSREIMAREGLRGHEVQIPVYDHKARRAPLPSPDELAKTASIVTLGPGDLSPRGEVQPAAVVTMATEAANRYLNQGRAALARRWPSLAEAGELAFSFFNLKLLIVPGATAALGDKVRVEVEFTPTGEGRGEFCVILSLAASGKPLLKAQGRGLTRRSS